MIERKLCSLILDSLVMFCCGTMASTGLYIYLHQSNSLLLCFIISGFVLIMLLALEVFLRSLKVSINLPQLLTKYCITIFQVVTGILMLISIIHHEFPLQEHIKHWDVLMTIIFVIEIFLTGIQNCLLTLELLDRKDKNYIDDLENNSITRGSPNVTYIQSQDRDTNTIEKGRNIEVIKKTSGQTLVDEETIHKYSEKMSNDDDDVDKKDIYTYFMQSMEGHNDVEYTKYIEENWMEHGPILNSLKFQNITVESNSDTEKSRKGSFSLFGSTKSDSPKKLRFSHSKSISNMNPSVTTQYNLRYSQSVPIFPKESQLESAERLKSPLHNMSTSHPSETIRENETRRISLINSVHDYNINKTPIINSEEDIPGDDYILAEAGTNKVFQRSKSTSQINKPNNKKRQQRWKSINDERVFLSNVSQSLLPSVLKSGESPIMKIKRQQGSYFKQDENVQKFNLNPEGNISPTVAKISHIDSNITSPLSYKSKNIGAANDQQKSNDIKKEETIEESDDDVDDDSLKLKYISEFDEEVEQSHFKDFDQNTIVNEVLKTAKNTYFNQFEELKEYSNSLKGLEEIPVSSTEANLDWNRPNRKVSAISHISLKGWDNNEKVWNERRTRSGVNLTLTRLASDHNFSEVKASSLKNSVKRPEYLIPPVECRVDNIDNLSDLESNSGGEIQRPYSLVLSNRSFSAPSLHTFRNVSQGTTSNKSELSYSSNEFGATTQPNYTLERLQTPTPINEIPNSTNSSPIRKFIQESPKRFTSVFRRKSTGHRQSYDLGSTKGTHKHTLSTTSYQYSLNSTVSSRSGSPRRTQLKALLSKPAQRNSLPYFSLPSLNSKTALSQPNVGLDLYFNSEKSSPGYEKANLAEIWDLDPSPSSDQSRVSSVPSVVIGEYDREKWRKLKELQGEVAQNVT